MTEKAGNDRQILPVARSRLRPITDLKGVGPAYARKLDKLDVRTISDLLRHLPRRYLDRSEFVPITSCRPGSEVQFSCEVRSIHPFRRNFRAILSDGTGRIAALWFNQPYLRRTIGPGQKLVVAGRVTDYRGGTLVVSDYELYDDGDDLGSLLGVGRLVPVYPSTEGLSQRWLRSRIRSALETVDLTEKEYLENSLLERIGAPPLPEAFRGIHFPESAAALEVSRRRLAFDELLLREIQFQLLRRERSSKPRPVGLGIDRGALHRLESDLPFRLSRSQEKALGEIVSDLRGRQPMYRLLQGEVGSGKSIVAYLAMTATALAGCQACLLAPTEILAWQHLQRLKLPPAGDSFETVLFTAASPTETADRVRRGEARLIVGTHALIHDRIDFRDLALLVVDEQQRFGIGERARLLAKGNRPHCLYLTATPIPRTFAQVLHGDMDISTLDPLESRRGRITTRMVPPERRADMVRFITERLAGGERAYFICPRRNETEGEDLLDVDSLVRELKAAMEPAWVEGLHGAMESDLQVQTLERFRRGEVRCLCATSVIEVGLDVPEATCMVIENPDRFGLSQLHQMRGRIGRGGEAGYFFMVSNPRLARPALERLETLLATDDGLEISRADLRHRGPGLSAGPAQHGWFPLRCVDLERDGDLQQASREIAAAILESDPGLKRPEHHRIRSEVESFRPISQLLAAFA